MNQLVILIEIGVLKVITVVNGLKTLLDNHAVSESNNVATK